MALAASLALVVGLGAGGLLWAPENAVNIAAVGDAPFGGPLQQALETLPSGTASADGVRPMLTFRDEAGHPCREFEIAGDRPGELEFGIACRRSSDGVWHVPIVVAAQPTDTTPESGFAPASGPAGDALEATLDALGAGPAITPEEEARLLELGWREAP